MPDAAPTQKTVHANAIRVDCDDDGDVIVLLSHPCGCCSTFTYLRPEQVDGLILRFVWRYLAGRGIDLARLPRLPGSLRCHPGLWHAKSGRYWPAMVAAIGGVGSQGKLVHAATQRTWLDGFAH